ncbi:MAG: YraN family protein [Hydrogenophaga sp.]|uniref:YraN family protein n=1 Tax=Hydrogenophaga sp. TaxID=1904254 RepID=UPI001BC389DF|nr:YraN family protein [Hydrogenophaga sp.]MBS3911005.1 YraN family protein [Hydrogenophaga sp.]MDO9149423.1 YraN family protein [Hydrogenophaga sp.]MDO9602959.1 YraN family protein [Hydrogenophaga sp.]MDP2166360.1 YraN family protein [Hydrogenophaga sp.]MDP3475758.1 YraN family protein [Hydrogenophaga sp.]
MWFSRKQGAPESQPNRPARPTTKGMGDAAEDMALAHLQRHGLALVQRNFKTSGRGGGEVDLIMREPDGTLVFVEVRQRGSTRQGGAGASITATKQRRIVLAARHFLLRLGSEPPCRFDVVLIQGQLAPPAGAAGLLHIDWLRAAFDASASF